MPNLIAGRIFWAAQKGARNLNLVSLYRARLTCSLRTPFTFVFIILAIAVSLSAMLLALEKKESSFQVGVVSEDTGETHRRFLVNLYEIDGFSMIALPRTEALLRLRQDRLEAVVIIPQDFTEKIERGEYQDTLELYASPSSQALATISEPLINAVMTLWMEEYTIEQTKSLLLREGYVYDYIEERFQRDQIESVWDQGSFITLKNVVLNPPEHARSSDGLFDSYSRWYGISCLFYLIISASWVIDSSTKSLHTRIGQTGTSKWKVVLTHSAAPTTICLAGYFLGGVVCSLFVGVPLSSVINFTLPMLIYLCGLSGITLLTASLVRSTVELMFLAPLLTFLHSVLSGLIFPLPQWAYVLVSLSRGLPGRWLVESLSAPSSKLIQALLCAIAWLMAGITVSLLCSNAAMAHNAAKGR